MPFNDSFTAAAPAIQAGELGEGASVVLSATEFQDGLIIGRFAKFDNNQIETLDGSATPVLAGVVLRSYTDLVFNPGTVSSDLPFYASEPTRNHTVFGQVAVEIGGGSNTPSPFSPVYAINAVGNIDNGQATTEATAEYTVLTTAQFLRPVEGATKLWWILIK
jgi:hypothetical protein